jgi:hypothetical protein
MKSLHLLNFHYTFSAISGSIVEFDSTAFHLTGCVITKHKFPYVIEISGLKTATSFHLCLVIAHISFAFVDVADIYIHSFFFHLHY